MRKGFIYGLMSVLVVSSIFFGASANGAVVIKGSIRGSVLLGPSCPVERVPPDPACAPKGYKTLVKVYSIKTGILQKSVPTNSLGIFSLTLPAGAYLLKAAGGSLYPRCTDKPVKVLAGKRTNVVMNCDTGIR